MLFEGLWVQIFLKQKILKSSEKAIKYFQNEFKGKIFLISHSIFHERIDAIAQTIRLILLLNINSKKKLSNAYYRKLNKLLKIMLNYQNINSNNNKIKGSFSWGKKSDGKILKHPNSWVTFFAIQALFLYKDLLEKKKVKFDEFNLV